MMKACWILTGIIFLAGLARAENFFPYGHHSDHKNTHHSTIEYEKQSVDDIITEGKDDELVKLSGEVIKKLKCSTYLFRDETGEIRINIDDEILPAKGVIFDTPITIKGEVIRKPGRQLKVDADKVRYMF